MAQGSLSGFVVIMHLACDFQFARTLVHHGDKPLQNWLQYLKQYNLSPDEAGKNRCRINNQTDLATELGLKVRPVKKILECVDATEGTIEPYDVMRFNCEEWATRMRYGRGWSSQVSLFITHIIRIILIYSTLFDINQILQGKLWRQYCVDTLLSPK